MRKIGPEIHLDTDEARSGETPHVMRYVLSISLVLAISAMSAIWITSAFLHRPIHGWSVSAIEHALGG